MLLLLPCFCTVCSDHQTRKALRGALKRDFRQKAKAESSLNALEATIISVRIPYAWKLFSDDVVFFAVRSNRLMIHNVLGFGEVLPPQMRDLTTTRLMAFCSDYVCWTRSQDFATFKSRKIFLNLFCSHVGWIYAQNTLQMLDYPLLAPFLWRLANVMQAFFESLREIFSI